ncbi:MAG TPA: calcium-binding protein [Beijerinckiaceae bacterium]|jgi:Ca2+-binding RTX toxin-like protein
MYMINTLSNRMRSTQDTGVSFFDTIEIGSLPQVDPLARYGTAGADVMVAASGGTFSEPSRTYAGGGDDVVLGTGGVDHIWGGTGDDEIYGGGGDDKLYGGTGDDVINGGAGFDWIEGGDGHDVLSSGSGFVHLDGGAGNDILHGSTDDISGLFGGDGHDTFYLKATDPAEGMSFVTGGAGWDVLVLDHVMAGSEVEISKSYGQSYKLWWEDSQGRQHVDIIDHIEQFKVGGVYYTFEQLFG